jgi:hypothetical protein
MHSILEDQILHVNNFEIGSNIRSIPQRLLWSYLSVGAEDVLTQGAGIL